MALNNAPESSREHKLTKLEPNNSWSFNVICGALTGIPAIYTAYPFKSTEKRVQMGKAPTLNPSILYKGSTGYASVFLGTLTSQYAVKTSLDEHLENPLLKNWLCGIASGPVAALSENLIVRQHLQDITLTQAIRSLYLEGGYLRFLRSWQLLCARESLFAPVNFLLSSRAGEFAVNYTGSEYARNPAELGTAAFASFISHPLERIATTIQKANHKMTIQEAFNDIMLNQGGTRGLMTGALCRIGVIATAIWVMNHMSKPVKDMVAACSIPSENLQTLENENSLAKQNNNLAIAEPTNNSVNQNSILRKASPLLFSSPANLRYGLFNSSKNKEINSNDLNKATEEIQTTEQQSSPTKNM